jgi:ATP-dependent DNA helicase RecG
MEKIKEVFGLDVLRVNSLPKDPNSSPKDEFSRHIDTLVVIATPVATAQRSPKALVERTILELCHGRYLLISELAQLLQREAAPLRNKYISHMLSQGRLKAEHPNIKNHPKQRYTTAGSPSKGSQVK